MAFPLLEKLGFRKPPPERLEPEGERLDHLLRERVKEQECLFRIMELTRDPGRPPEEVLSSVVEAVPPGWQHPEAAEARIVLGEREFRTSGYTGSGPSLEEAMVVGGEEPAFVEVRYREDSEHLGPLTFLKEESRLLHQVAVQVGLYLERRRDFQEREDRSSRLLALMDGLDEITYVADPDTHELLHVNQAFREAWGDGMGKKCHEVIHGRRDPCPFCTNDRIFGENLGNSHIWEFRNEKSHRWYRCSDKAIRWPDGRDVRFEIAFDVTEEKALREALEESEARFRRLAENAPDMIYRMSLPDGAYQYVSPASEKIWGYTPEEVYAKPLLIADCIHPAWQGYFRKEWERLLEGKAPPTYEYPIIAKDGSRKWLLQRNTVVRNSEGAPVAIEGIVSEITHRMEVEERFRKIFELSADPICVADTRGRFQLLNPAWDEVLGYPVEELTGRSLLDFVHPDDQEPTMAVLQGKLEAGETAVSFRNRLLRKDGGIVWLDWTAQPSLAQNQMFAIARNVTDQVEAEEAMARDGEVLRSLAEDLKRSNEELEQFAYVASHDLQEPLRMVASFTELLRRELGDSLEGAAEEYMDFVVDGANRMQALINDLLAYSRVGTRGEEPRASESKEALGRAMAALLSRVEETGAVVTNGPLPPVLADPSQLTRLFQNLIGNAIRFSGERAARVHITAEPENGFWRFSVTDNGIGIPTEFSERVFQIFQRLHPRGKYEGTGIGLAICKRIVERHGGRIWCEGEEGVGTTFFFTLPDPSGGSQGPLHSAMTSEGV